MKGLLSNEKHRIVFFPLEYYWLLGFNWEDSQGPKTTISRSVLWSKTASTSFQFNIWTGIVNYSRRAGTCSPDRTANKRTPDVDGALLGRTQTLEEEEGKECNSCFSDVHVETMTGVMKILKMLMGGDVRMTECTFFMNAATKHPLVKHGGQRLQSSSAALKGLKIWSI